MTQATGYILIGVFLWLIALTFILSTLRMAKVADERMEELACEEFARKEGSR